MIFDYSVQKTFTQSIVVDDPGNMALRCSSVGGEEYYIIARTIMGKTFIITLGPSLADTPNVFLDRFSFNLIKMNYSEKKLAKTIETFINDPIKQIAEVVEISLAEALQSLPNLVEAFNNL